MAEKRLEVLITGNAKDAQKAFGDLEKSASKSGKKTTSALSGIQRGLVGLGVAGAAIGSFKAFEESAKIGRQTEAVIKSTGQSAGVTADHVADLSAEMSKLGGVDDEADQQGANMLLTFTKVRNEVGKGNDIFDQATLAANNYAAATGTDVVNANKMLGKALNDPIKGLAALTKAGVTFDDQQKAQIKTMVANGDTMGAQKIILSEFSKEYGGSLEANATASGKAQVAAENLGESVGAILAPGLEASAGAAEHGAEALEGLPRPAQQAIVGVVGLSTAALVAGPRIVSMASSLKDGVSALKDWSSQAGNLSRVGTGLGVAAAGVGAFTLTLEALNAASATNTDMAGLSKDLEQLADGSASLSDVASTLGTDVEGLGLAFAKSSESPHDFGEAIGYLGTHFKSDTFGTGLTKAQNQVEDFDTALAGLVSSGNPEAAASAYGELSAELIDQGVTAKEVAGMLPQYWTEVDRSERSNKGATAAVKENEAATNSARIAGDGWLGSNRELISAFQDRILKQDEINAGLQTSIDLSYASVDANLALRAAHDSVQDATVALDEARRNGSSPETIQRSQDDLTAAIMRESVATREAAAANAEAAGKSFTAGEAALIQRAKLAELQTQTGFTSAELRGLVSNLDNASRGYQVKLETAQAQANVASLRRETQAFIDTLSLGATLAANSGLYGETGSGMSGSIGVSGTAQNSRSRDRGGRQPGRAAGGPIEAGMVYEVNERGQELFAAGMDGTIISAPTTKQILSGASISAGSRSSSGVTNIFHIDGSKDPEATAAAVVKHINRLDRMGQNPLHFGGRRKVTA